MRGAPKSDARPTCADGIVTEITRIAALKLAEVRALWTRSFGKTPPKCLSRDILVRQLAWRIQEKAFGGHDAGTLKLLKTYAGQDESKVVLFRRLKAGTVVVREYQGVRHVVAISESGFVWEGRTYNSLSAIAREITGAQWNGPRFFGLRKDAGSTERKAS